MAGGISKANQRQGSKRKTRYEAYRNSGRVHLNGLKRLIRHAKKLAVRLDDGGAEIKAAYARHAASMPNVARSMLAEQNKVVQSYLA